MQRRHWPSVRRSLAADDAAKVGAVVNKHVRAPLKSGMNQCFDTETCSGARDWRRRGCGIYPYGSLSFSSSLEDGGFTLLRHNVPSASRWFASTSTKQDADMRS